MRRLGYAQLQRFGLVLTPDQRILSMRPAVLDDGFGGRIVGWQDHDLAGTELASWELTRPAPPSEPPRWVPTPVSAVTMPEPAVPLARGSIPPALTPAHAMIPERVAPVVQADEPEDEWEWEIAVARSRHTTSSHRVEPVLRAAPDPEPRRAAPPVAGPGPVLAPAARRPTVIQVSPMPTLADMRSPHRFEPVVRRGSPARTFPRGTQPAEHRARPPATELNSVHDEVTTMGSSVDTTELSSPSRLLRSASRR